MRLGIITNMRGVSWAGSETVWHLAAMQALRDGHSVTALLHPDLTPATQIADFRRAGGRVHTWQSFSIARFQGLKEKFFPSFPNKLLCQFDAILVSLGSLPALNYVPGVGDPPQPTGIIHFDNLPGQTGGVHHGRIKQKFSMLKLFKMPVKSNLTGRRVGGQDMRNESNFQELTV